MSDIIREQDSRTAALLGSGACDILKKSKVAVFGVGGVGGNLCEALARAGVGQIDLFDGDVVSESNINRQIIALHSTVGRPKVEVMKERIADINPDCKVNIISKFYLPENEGKVNADHYPFLYCKAELMHNETEIDYTKYYMFTRKK